MGTCGDVGAKVPPTVTAASYVLADLDTGAILAARAPHARERPASCLKILTSLVVVDRLSPDAVVGGTASDLRVDGSKAGIGPGGQYTVRQLMAGLLLPSGNDAAEALSRAMGGDAADIRRDDHRPAARCPRHPSRHAVGPRWPGHGDLRLRPRGALPRRHAQAALRGDDRDALGPFPGYGDKPGFMLGNNDQFVPSYKGAIAAKSGFTDAARHTLVATAQRGGRRLVVALMRGEQHPVSMTAQAATLLDMGFATPPSATGVGTLVDGPPRGHLGARRRVAEGRADARRLELAALGRAGCAGGGAGRRGRGPHVGVGSGADSSPCRCDAAHSPCRDARLTVSR